MKAKSFNVEALAAKRAALKALKVEIAELVEVVKQEKVNMAEARAVEKAQKVAAKEAKAAARAQKKAEKIAALEAKLNALRNPVGSAARKAARRPSKVVVTKVA